VGVGGETGENQAGEKKECEGKGETQGGEGSRGGYAAKVIWGESGKRKKGKKKEIARREEGKDEGQGERREGLKSGEDGGGVVGAKRESSCDGGREREESEVYGG